MRCKLCNVGDLHYSDFKFKLNIPFVWRSKIIEKEFSCDNCGRSTWIKVQDANYTESETKQ